MFRTLRTTLLIGLMPLLALMIGLGIWATVMFYRLGGNIDVILRENYRSVLAAEKMKEALERIDSSFLFALAGREERAHAQFAEYRPRFEKALTTEQNNVTLPGEQALADELTSEFGRYLTLANRFYELPDTPDTQRTEVYFADLLPMFKRIKDRADDVLNLNQRNMEQMDTAARQAATTSIRLMIVALLVTGVVGFGSALILSRSILEPIRAVTRGARELARGNIDQVVPVLTRDELGELASSFNVMARTIREYRQAGTAKLVRAQQSAQATIDSFPDPVVVVDPTGAIERANPAARRVLSVVTFDSPIPWNAPSSLKPLLDGVLSGEPDYLPTGIENAIVTRHDGQERFYLPRVLAIRDEADALIGAAVVLLDVTRFRLLDQIKSDMVSTVSHELKTPLTSIQMVVHLLLEEVIGTLTPKQVELLLAARQDSERLLTMVNDLLDLTRIEQGRVQLDRAPVAAADLLSQAAARFEPAARDADVSVSVSAPNALPHVLVDRDRIEHVFDNLIGNAIAYAPRGGHIRLSAQANGATATFSVSDDGRGIPPEYLPRIFEKFYRVPGPNARGGAGLGLAIAREIVVAHGGQIDVRSTVGQGTTFTFAVPSVLADQPSEDGGPHHEH